MIRFACPGCNATFTVPGEKAGKASKCPKCRVAFQIPDAYPEPVPPPPSPPVPMIGGQRPPNPPPVSRNWAPPPPVSANDPIEIQPCPKCQTRLSVLAGDIGSEIECPQCRTVYKAARADAPPPPSHVVAPPPSSKLMQLGGGRSQRDEEEEEERRRKRRRRSYEDDDEDDRPIRRRVGKRPPGTVRVTRLGPLSVGLNSGAIYAIMALIFGLLGTVIFGCIGAVFGAQLNDSRVAGFVGAGVLMMAVYTLLYALVGGVGGFIGGVIFALIYNLVAKATGGVEMDLE